MDDDDDDGPDERLTCERGVVDPEKKKECGGGICLGEEGVD